MLKKYGAPSHTHTLHAMCVKVCVSAGEECVCRSRNVTEMSRVVNRLQHVRYENDGGGTRGLGQRHVSGEAPSPPGLWRCQRVKSKRCAQIAGVEMHTACSLTTLIEMHHFALVSWPWTARRRQATESRGPWQINNQTVLIYRWDANGGCLMLKRSLADNGCVLRGKVLFLEMKPAFLPTTLEVGLCLCLEVEDGCWVPHRFLTADETNCNDEPE